MASRRSFVQACKYGLLGMLTGLLWLVFSFGLLLIFDKTTAVGKIVFGINLPLLYVTDTVLTFASIPTDNFSAVFFVMLVLYLTSGLVLGMCFYSIVRYLRLQRTVQALSGLELTSE